VQLDLAVEAWYNPKAADVQRRKKTGQFHGLNFAVRCKNNGSQAVEIRSLHLETEAGLRLTKIRNHKHGRVWHVSEGEANEHVWHDFLASEPLVAWYDLDDPPKVRAVVKFATGHKQRTAWEKLPSLRHY
jgi:hypothetical protein